MRKLGYIISILIYSAFLASAQNESNIWYFGENAGLDFNSGIPVALIDGQLVTQEGCVSIADNNGDLLFYTDGSLVYNKNHLVMPNGSGLTGDFLAINIRQSLFHLGSTTGEVTTDTLLGNIFGKFCIGK